MPKILRPSGLTVSVPETLIISERATPGAPAGRGRKLPRGPVPIDTTSGAGADTDALLAAIEQQEMRVVDRFEVQPTLESTPASGQRRGGAEAIPPVQTMDLTVDLGADEDAVLLVEQGGMFAWQLPESTTAIAAGTAGATPTGRTITRGQPSRRAQFRLPLHSNQPAPGAVRRGLVTDFVYDKVRVYALKFAARVFVGQAVKYLERNVHKGLVQMAALNPQEWKPVTAAQLRIPSDRPARILLFVHGTFSSTSGSFGALCGTPWGQAFLSAAAAHYDAVIGFDHATLGDDPIGNASELLNALEPLGAKFPPVIDAIAFSRGGLVLRSLIEHLLPNSPFKGRVHRAVFVACTNAGTKLANPDNWRTLLDIYTNASVAAFRLLSVLPQMQVPAIVLKELVQSIGAFVKYVATNAATDIPGLAAMQPEGDFVKCLNQIQPGQPLPAESLYYAVTCDFKPSLTGGDHVPKELPLRLVTALANGFIDQLMGAPNDLVVDTASMTSIDPDPGGFIKDTLAFGSTASVYHTCYFVRPEVVNACTRWLELPLPRSDISNGMVSLRTPQKRATRGAARVEGHGILTPAPLPRPGSPGVIAPAAVDTDIIVASAGTMSQDLVGLVEEKSPSYVVVTRLHKGRKLAYAFRTEEVLSRAAAAGAASADLETVMNLHETDASTPQSISEAGPFENPGGSMSARRGVVLVEGRPVGVVPVREENAGAIDIVDLAVRAAQAPSSTQNRVILRRAMPTFAQRPEALEPAKVSCHFLAEMESQVQVNHVATVEVSVSREALAAAAGRTSATAESLATAAEKIIVQVITKVNFATVGDDRAEIDVPAPGEPAVIYFDVKAIHEGDGEIWVIARQRQSAIARLVLRPAIMGKQELSAARTRAEAHAAEAPVLDEPLNQLMIIEQISGAESRFFFEIEFPELNLFRTFLAEPLRTDRAAYVTARYKEIEDRYVSTYDQEKHAADAEAFTKELQAIGTGMFEQLLPVELQQILWKHRDALRSIRVVSTDPLIPWELMHLKEPGTRGLGAEMRFLAQMGLVRWLYNVDGLPPKEIAIHQGKARYVIPDYKNPNLQLPETKLERDFLVREFGASAIEPQPNPVRQSLEQPGNFDLLHFACHGEADSGDITDAQVVLEDRIEGQNFVNTFLNAATVGAFANLKAEDGQQPMIVLNACQAGRAGYTLTGIGGFAEGFLRGGAGLFVGTLWSVGDFPARAFTQEFYTQLKDQHKTVAEAAIAAREKARAAGDATWLAYVVYGHPHARLRIV
jgi:hypothetical protein